MACPGKIKRSPGTLNCLIFQTVPNLSRSECNVTSHVDKVTHRPNTYTEFVVVRCILSSSKFTKSIFGRGSAPDPLTPLRELTMLPRPLAGWGGGPSPCLSPWRLNSVPIFYHRFMVNHTDRASALKKCCSNYS